MKRLIATLLATTLAAGTAEAAQIRYDFAGTLTPTLSFPPGNVLETGSGLPGGYSGFVIFDTAAADQDADPENEVYFASGFGLTVGNYSLPTGADAVFASVNPGAGSFVLNFLSPTGFGPAAVAQDLSFFISFTGAFAPGIVQAPLAASGFADLSVAAADGSILLASGDVTSVVAAVVPEPATWALMIAGFGLIGGAMRRNRAAPARPSFEG